MTGLLEVTHVVKEYRRGDRVVRAIDDLSLEVHAGEFVSIVGPSGCGKSTLLHMVGGFVPWNGGMIVCDGKPVTQPGPDRGVIFQNVSLFPWRSVIGNVVWGLEAQGVKQARCLEIGDELLKTVGLQDFRDHYPDELSGGMKQRVALARTLAYDPRLLLMDEPFGALDAQTRELMQEELQRVWEQSRKTVLFVTHDIEEAIFLSDRVIVFTARPGRLKEEIAIELPRPRLIEIKKSIAFLEYRNRIWDALRGEVLRSLQDSAL
jgi:NitT/TauT family transport system ATP-binding protein